MQVPNSWLWYSLLVIGWVIWVVSALEKRHPTWQFYLRKSLHIVVIFVAAVASMCSVSVWLPILSWVASVLLWIAIKRGWFEEVVAGEQTRKPWGMVYFSVIYAMLTSLPWGLEECSSQQWLILRWMNGWSFCTLAFADGLAGIVGRWGTTALGLDTQKGKGIFKLDGERKSWVGFVVFWFVSVVVALVFRAIGVRFLAVGLPMVDSVLLPQLLVLGFVVAMVEMVSGKGSDNLFVVVAVWLYAGAMSMGFMGKPHAIFLAGTLFLFFYVLLSVVAVIWLNRKGILDNTGAVMAWILAFVVMVMAGWSLWPLVVFLGLASLIGRFRKKLSDTVAGDLKEGKPRDRWQVLANGGLYMVCAVIAYAVQLDVVDVFGLRLANGFGEKLELLALVSLSASCADTLSSEIGQWMGGMPRSITTGKKMLKGVSGGVTMAGFLGAIIGSVAVGLCVYLSDWMVLTEGLGWTKWQFFLMVAGFGLMGTIVDSFLGDLFQAKYRTGEGDFLDRPIGDPTQKPDKGFRFMNNDVVNFTTGLLILIIAWTMFF
ncbi:MAG: DUF92 domain-containing protein [Bacteroidia bacterium]